jgi:hypothetical protein
MKLIKEIEERIEKSKAAIFECPYCQKHFKAAITRIKNGSKKSCGCLTAMVARERAKTLYKARKPTDHRTKTRLYRYWQEIKQSCNPNTKKYNGTTICKEWEKYEPFKEWYDKNYIEGLFLCWKNRHVSPKTCHFDTKEESFNQKRRDTNIEKYGSKEFCSTDIFKEKTKNTILDRYGVDHISKDKNIKKKAADSYKNMTEEKKVNAINKKKKTCLEKYGVEHPQQLDSVKKKQKQTYLLKYGVENPQQLESIKNKTIETNRKKYGYDYHTQKPDFIEKIKKINLKKYGCEFYTQTEEYKELLLQKRIENENYYTIEGKTIPMFLQSKGLDISYTTALSYYKEYGDSFADHIKDNLTLIENKIKVLLQRLDLEFKEKKFFNGVFPDFLINDNLVIECDGLYWHSDAIMKDNNYHVKKKAIYQENGIKSLFFREDEIHFKFDIVTSIISNTLGLSQKIFGRKTIVKEVDIKTASKFCENNHLMGSGQGRSFGLYYNDELVTLIRVKKKKDGLDISRFCHKLNTSVIGGFSKLLKHIEKEISPKFIQTFIDQRYGTGEYLTDLGFQLETLSPSFCWVKNREVKHRLTFPGNSGYKEKYNKLWDCGQAKWVKYV